MKFALAITFLAANCSASQPPWLDPTLPTDQRVSSLMDELTLAETISQLGTDSPAIGRLSVPAYSWWSEGAHGVAWGGKATVFPALVGVASSFNADSVYEMGRVIGKEGRAKHNDARAQNQNGDTGDFQGLDFFAPNVNIVRDVRWGRGQETFGEDPVLTSILAKSLIMGMQSKENTDRPMVYATSKHFFAYNFESDFADGGHDPQARLSANVNVTNADLLQTYLPAFRATTNTSDGGAYSVMCSYNSVNGIPACAHPALKNTLRSEFDFDGYVVSDCGAIGWMGFDPDSGWGHNYTNDDAESSAAGILAGVDLCCGSEYLDSLQDALDRGLVTEGQLRISMKRLLTHRIKVGLLDPVESDPFANINSADDIDTAESRRLARLIATESMVLLKNEGDILPLNGDKLKKIAVLGPNAARKDVLLSNYPGCTSGPGAEPSEECELITALEGIQKGFDGEVVYEMGVDIDTNRTDGFATAIDLATSADVAIIVAGLITCQETGDQCQEAEAFDRTKIDLPGRQEQFVEALVATGVPVILVLLSGATVSVTNVVGEGGVKGLIQGWYPGEEGGNAIADIIFGRANPSGRLSETIFQSLDDLPEYLSLGMSEGKGRTHRYFSGESLYSFGYGLTYSRREYSELQVQKKEGEGEVRISAKLEQTSGMDGEEVVQLYVQYLGNEAEVAPLRELKNFTRIALTSEGGKVAVEFVLGMEELWLVGKGEDELRLLEGEYKFSLGGVGPGSQGKFVNEGDANLQILEEVLTI